MNAVPIHQVVQVVAWAAFPRRGYEQVGWRAEAVGVRGERPEVAARGAAVDPGEVPVDVGTAVPTLAAEGSSAEFPARVGRAAGVGGMCDATQCFPIVVLAQLLWAEVPHGTAATALAAGLGGRIACPENRPAADSETAADHRRDRDTKPPA
jgi:hypothetical protein